MSRRRVEQLKIDFHARRPGVGMVGMGLTPSNEVFARVQRLIGEHTRTYSEALMEAYMTGSLWEGELRTSELLAQNRFYQAAYRAFQDAQHPFVRRTPR